MKKFLPKTRFNSSGFTLIELMVVVAIIAILSVIGFAIFQNAQRNARDGIRRGEINNLAKSIESSKDPTAGTYSYTTGNFSADFPTNKPKDPLKASIPVYCVATSTSAVPGEPTAWVTTGATATACPSAPSGYSKIVDEAGAYNTDSATNALNTGIKYWKICTKLEVPGTAFCIGAQAQ